MFLVSSEEQCGDFLVETKCTRVPAFNGRYYEDRGRDTYHFDYFGKGILEAICSYEVLATRYISSDDYFLHIPNTWSYTSFLMLNTDYAFVLSPISVNTDNLCHKNDMIVYSGSRVVCESAKSYFDSKLVRYLLLLGMNIQNPFRRGRGDGIIEANGNAMRYVPDPGPFDHIFTDEELYTKYNLSDD